MIEALLAALIGVAFGAGGYYTVQKRQGAAAGEKADALIKDAKSKAKTIELEAMVKALRVAEEAARD